MIERDQSPEQALAIAEAYLADDRLEEAVIFLGKAGADDRLDALTEQAVELGDVFLLSEIARVRGHEPEPAVWQRLAESARRAGKDVYAETAERHAHRSDD
jgi:hypothetical protein